ncbi:MAG: hypothetical protein RL086_565 [Bacteroidota bacterium]|jgi:hypothetical protein
MQHKKPATNKRKSLIFLWRDRDFIVQSQTQNIHLKSPPL